MPAIGFQGVSPYDRDEKNHRREIARVVNNILTGKLNANLRITLSAGITTTITDARIGYDSAFHFWPETATAAGMSPWATSTGRVDGSITLNHATISSSAAIYLMTIIG